MRAFGCQILPLPYLRRTFLLVNLIRGDFGDGYMLYLPNYAGAFRCIGQALQTHEIEVFELSSFANEFRVVAGDPNPPYTALIELKFSVQDIEVLDREGQARRGQSTTETTNDRFDSVPEVLRAVGEYIDHKRGYLRRVDNSSEAAVEIEYQTRAGDVQTENLATSLIHETCVHMYKRRTRRTNPISILSHKR